MLKKQKLTIIISAVLIVALAVVYFTVVAPMLKETETKDIPELIEGETYSEAYSKIMIFPKIEQADIKEIKIHNKHAITASIRTTRVSFTSQAMKAPPSAPTSLPHLRQQYVCLWL